MATVTGGSSPLARGGHRTLSRIHRPPGLIPARAGRTSPRPPQGRDRRAHPRSRGADLNDLLGTLTGLGSSPLARGGLRREGPATMSAGLIPARAGRTGGARRGALGLGAHPRSRGADGFKGAAAGMQTGSSPLARGGRPRRAQRRPERGLIPARAGRTSSRRTPARPPWAHPRSRGADLALPLDLVRVQGSSPLARGGRRVPVLEGRGGGLIPARAGRTCATRHGRRKKWAHPRSRGADS